MRAETERLIEEIEKSLALLRRRLGWETAEHRLEELNATAGYAECMAGEGFPDITDPEAATSAITLRMEPLYASASTSLSASTSVPPFDRALLDEIEADEIATAIADLACGEELRRVTFAVRSEYEERFIEQYRSDLERYRALTSG